MLRLSQTKDLMKIISKRVTVVAALSVAWIPAGCSELQQREQVEVVVDTAPVEREASPVVSSYASVLNVVRPAVVSVYSRRSVDETMVSEHPVLERFFGSRDHRNGSEQIESGLGSGVIVSPQGYVLTNNHVIAGADEIAISLEDGREIPAKLVGTDPRTDVAVLRIDSEDLPHAILADSDTLQVGDVVFALGNALGIGHAVTTGIISARGRTGIGILGEEGYEDFIQTDASMNVGNSGGPLVDSRGRVIGINTAIASPGGGNVGIGFAIPINMARSVMESLIEFGEVQRGYLGITLQDLTSELAEEFDVTDGGVLVVNVFDDSPAHGAGLLQGDVVVGLNGEAVESAGLLRLRVGQLPPDSQVDLSVLRDGQSLDVPVVLGKQEERADDHQASLERDELLQGVAVTELTPALRNQLEVADDIVGLVVTDADRSSPFAESFPIGSVILQINRQPVAEVDEAKELIQEGRNLFLMLMDGSFQYVTVKVHSS